MLELGHVLLCRRLFRERPREHEFGLEHGLCPLDDPIEGSRHPGERSMLYPALDVPHPPARIALVPGSVEVLGGGPQLHDEVAREVFWIDLATLLLPQADQSFFISPHDDSSVRSANEKPATSEHLCPYLVSHFSRYS
jgi:hypothetical protein